MSDTESAPKARDEFPVDHAGLLERVNREHRTSFSLARVFGGGEFGAAEVVDPEGRSFVLKAGDARQAAAATELLSGLGYPAPRYVVVAPGYSVQEKLPGDPLPVWALHPPGINEQVLELNELQAGRAPEDQTGWPSSILQPVLEGVKPWVDLDGMQEHSPRAARLLARCQQIVRQHSKALPPAADLMHFDFSPDNVLVEDGAITGVIDWDGVRSGDRHFDLATFLFYSVGARPLRNSIVEASGGAALAVYLAYLSVRQTAWSIRFHGVESGRDIVDGCTALLDELAL